MNNKTIISIIVIVAILASLLAGYFLGATSIKEKDAEKVVEVKWIKGDTVRDTIQIPVPYKVEVPVEKPIFVYTDTDALFAVWQDYYLKRDYKLDFSNDTLGTFVADVSIQENKLVRATSFIRPNIRTVTEKETTYKVNIIQPWVIVGTSVDFSTQKLQVGVDIKNKFVVGVSGIRLNDKYSYTIDLGIKF